MGTERFNAEARRLSAAKPQPKKKGGAARCGQAGRMQNQADMRYTTPTETVRVRFTIYEIVGGRSCNETFWGEGSDFPSVGELWRRGSLTFCSLTRRGKNRFVISPATGTLPCRKPTELRYFFDDLPSALSAAFLTGMDLNFRVSSVRGFSKASRSRLEAPTKPRQSVCSLM